jgi:hypothetical protein
MPKGWETTKKNWARETPRMAQISVTKKVKLALATWYGGKDDRNVLRKVCPYIREQGVLVSLQNGGPW